jgi:hypothetical protein
MHVRAQARADSEILVMFLTVKGFLGAWEEGADVVCARSARQSVVRARVCYLLEFNSVTSTPQWIKRRALACSIGGHSGVPVVLLLLTQINWH